jgi:uncharacterized protein (DUF2267 family)
MTSFGLEVFDSTIQQTHIWLKELMAEFGTTDRHQAYAALRAVLHALRDRLGPDEAAHLGAQLPLLVRGVYFEGWRPAGKPLKSRSADEFLEPVRQAFWQEQKLTAERIASAVFALLARHVTAGEIADIVQALPAEVRALWPEGSYPETKRHAV